MTDDPVDLDTRRRAEGRIAADIRRQSLKDFEADQRALRLRQEDLEAQLLAQPAANWHEAALKAQYLIRRYSETAEARDDRRQDLIERAWGSGAADRSGGGRSMTKLVEQDNGPVRALADVPKERLCLCCRRPFASEGFGERICRRCKALRSRQTAVQPTHSSRPG